MGSLPHFSDGNFQGKGTRGADQWCVWGGLWHEDARAQAARPLSVTALQQQKPSAGLSLAVSPGAPPGSQGMPTKSPCLLGWDHPGEADSPPDPLSAYAAQQPGSAVAEEGDHFPGGEQQPARLTIERQTGKASLAFSCFSDLAGGIERRGTGTALGGVEPDGQQGPTTTPGTCQLLLHP